MENENLENNSLNLKDKIKNSQIYQRLIYRPFKMGTARSAISVMLYGILLMILFMIMSYTTDVKPKIDSELYKTTGIVVKNNINEHTGTRGTTTSGIHILTDNNETIRFYYIYKKGLKLADKNLIGKKITIYSNILPVNFYKPFADKVIDEKGNILKEYDYKWQQSIRNYVLSYKPMLIVLFLLILIYLINGKNTKKFDVENYWNNQNLKSQTKE
ncbi:MULTISPECIES: hypothetical protein [unclassified Campylobacter]|uniref:hypothetical protein n=1 Tax=unclassified Campylobacter TaxID=2593542 RepID=UPI0022E9AFF7|nr:MULTISPECIES: hypothetical protein [unclassified Campylobacter]MDA3079017.1 hypothetical protein [Campylobacter sp. CS_NA2]MDA3080692.1 hypothetical protein [Campylobacter sp. CS_NA1]MDA3085103.1 hypothetical protein [Campylobacter sp. CS_ED1]MDA3089880.1 hypothetical protein [Campylobacter sp. CS_ED2]WBR51563.1 hypothetical protein PF026_01610 [Campylobacter sp. CS_NA3]